MHYQKLGNWGRRIAINLRPASTVHQIQASLSYMRLCFKKRKKEERVGGREGEWERERERTRGNEGSLELKVILGYMRRVRP